METTFQDRLSRLAPAVSTARFLYFALALSATLWLALAEWSHRRTEARAGTMAAPESPRAAVAANPRDSAAWIALGLAAERAHKLTEAAQYFAEARRVDRRYLPAWASANFFFRQGNREQFWEQAARAASLIYDDPGPLLELADRTGPDPVTALARLRATPSIERAYLDFLIGKGQWDSAHMVAVKILARANPADSERLRDFTDRLIGAGRGEAALALCRKSGECAAPDLAARNILVNGNFAVAPAGRGFDWRVLASPETRTQWKSGELGWSFTDSGPDELALLEQWVVLGSRRCRLEFEYWAPAAGLRWAMGQGDSWPQSGPALAASGTWMQVRWRFAMPATGLARLRLLYRREPGTRRIAGRAAVRRVRLEVL